MTELEDKRQTLPGRRRTDIAREDLTELIIAANEVLERQGINWFALQRLRKAVDKFQVIKGESV